MPSVLFICTANICRSPMAEAIFRDLLSLRSDTAQWSVESAGTWGMDGYQAASGTRAALGKLGLSADGHVARTVTREILNSSDLILTMERGHQEALRLEFPQEAKRIFLLTEMVGSRFDIRDPIGEPQTAFDSTAQDLKMLLSQGMENITEIAVKNAAMRKDMNDTIE